MPTTRLTGTLIKSGSIPVTALGGGVVSSSGQVTNLVPAGTVSSSTQFKTLTDPFTGSFTGSFNGDGSNLSGIASSLTFSGSTGGDTLNLKTETFTINGSNGITTSVSNNTLTVNLPSGTVSSSAQATSWTVLSASFASTASYISGNIEFSNGLDVTGSLLVLGNVSATSLTGSILSPGVVSASSQYPGWVTASSQIDYNSITNKLSGVVSSSTQVQPLLPGGTVSSSGQVDYNSITNKLSGVYSSSTQAVAAIAGQTIAPSIINATGAISGASIQASGNGTIGGNLTVSGTITATSQSIQYISSSQFNVATNKIIINTDNALRFGGISVVDSGSAGKSGSLYWDSLNDRWLYEDVTGGTYNSAIIVAGPQNTGATGAERGLLIGRVPVASGDDHIDTAAASSSIRVDFPSRLTHIEAGAFITGNLTANGTVTLQGIYSSSGQVDITTTTGYTTFSSSLATIDAGQNTRIDNLASLTSSYAINSTIQSQLAGVASSSAQVKAYLPNGTVSSSAQYPGWVTASSQIDYNSITNKLSGVYSSSAFTTVNQGTLRLSLNGVALSDVDTGLQTTDGPTFAGMVSTAIISGSGASYRLVVPVGTNYYAT